jgi:hypothetical protein
MAIMGISVYLKGDYKEFPAIWVAKKQTQFKANLILAPRPVLGVERQFEKTKPILWFIVRCS